MSRVCHGPWYNVIQIYWMDGWMNEHLGYYRIEWTSRSLSYHKNLSLEMSYTLFWWSWSTSYKFTWEYDHPAHMFPHCIYNAIIKGVFMCFSQVIIQYLWFFSWFISYVTTGCKKEVNMRVYQEIWMRMSIAACSSAWLWWWYVYEICMSWWYVYENITFCTLNIYSLFVDYTSIRLEKIIFACSRMSSKKNSLFKKVFSC